MRRRMAALACVLGCVGMLGAGCGDDDGGGGPEGAETQTPPNAASEPRAPSETRGQESTQCLTDAGLEAELAPTPNAGSVATVSLGAGPSFIYVYESATDAEENLELAKDAAGDAEPKLRGDVITAYGEAMSADQRSEADRCIGG